MDAKCVIAAEHKRAQDEANTQKLTLADVQEKLVHPEAIVVFVIDVYI